MAESGRKKDLMSYMKLLKLSEEEIINVDKEKIKNVLHDIDWEEDEDKKNEEAFLELSSSLIGPALFHREMMHTWK